MAELINEALDVMSVITTIKKVSLLPATHCSSRSWAVDSPNVQLRRRNGVFFGVPSLFDLFFIELLLFGFILATVVMETCWEVFWGFFIISWSIVELTKGKATYIQTCQPEANLWVEIWRLIWRIFKQHISAIQLVFFWSSSNLYFFFSFFF